MLEFLVHDQSQVAETRRIILNNLTYLNSYSEYLGKLSIIITELCTNLIKHTISGGRILFHVNAEENYCSFISIDMGEGIKDVNESLKDGFSTTGSIGGGLGAIKRMSDFFDIYSSPEGTIVASIIYLKPRPIDHLNRFGSINIPKTGEEISGDNLSYIFSPKSSFFMIADGLGHGLSAAEASAEATTGFIKSGKESITRILEELHDRLRPTRGAAVSIAEINHENDYMMYAGIGNVNCVIIYPDYSTKSVVTHNGIVGHEMRETHEYKYTWINNATLIMHSDGLSNKWNLEKYPGILNRSPLIIAALLYRDASKGNDDSTILVYKDYAPV